MEEELTDIDTNTEELSPEEAKASLGLSTRLSEQFLMSQAEQQAMEQGMTEPEASVEPETAPDREKTIRDEYPAQELDNEKLDMVLDEISEIKEEIQKALDGDKDVDNEDNQNGQA